MSAAEEITPLIDAKLKELGFELYDLRFFQAGTHSILRIVIDSPEGVKIADCAHASREISLVLDEKNFSEEHPYNLEVSSPGIDRPLKTERDYRRIVGRDVSLHLTSGVDGKKTVTGEVVACEDNKLTIKLEKRTVEIPLSDIYSGKEEIRFK
jgi:ribosome maturation factor RimP